MPPRRPPTITDTQAALVRACALRAERLGLDNHDLAARTGLSQRTVSRILSVHHVDNGWFSWRAAEALCAALGWEVVDALSWARERALRGPWKGAA